MSVGLINYIYTQPQGADAFWGRWSQCYPTAVVQQ